LLRLHRQPVISKPSFLLSTGSHAFRRGGASLVGINVMDLWHRRGANVLGTHLDSRSIIASAASRRALVRLTQPYAGAKAILSRRFDSEIYEVTWDGSSCSWEAR
jgi:hypothetical protein